MIGDANGRYVPVEFINPSTMPVDSINSSNMPVDSINSSTVPVESITISTIPVESINSSTEPVESINLSTVPVESINSSTVPVDSISSSTAYLLNHSQTYNVSLTTDIHLPVTAQTNDDNLTTTLLQNVTVTRHLSMASDSNGGVTTETTQRRPQEGQHLEIITQQPEIQENGYTESTEPGHLLSELANETYDQTTSTTTVTAVSSEPVAGHSVTSNRNYNIPEAVDISSDKSSVAVTTVKVHRLLVRMTVMITSSQVSQTWFCNSWLNNVKDIIVKDIVG